MLKAAKGFEQQTNDNKIFSNPYVACKSSDGNRWIIAAWVPCHHPWANAPVPCLHSDPKFPDLKYDGSELQFLPQFNPYPYGISPHALAYP